MDKKKLKLLLEIVGFILALCLITFFYYYSGDDSESVNDESDVQMVKINDENFEEEVLNSQEVVVLEFYSNMCPPCLSMIPTMINIAKNEDIKVATVNNSDSNTSSIVEKYNVEATPTILIFKDGEIIKSLVGAVSEDTIMKEIK